MTHRQHVPFGGVLDVPRISVRTHELKRPFLLAFLKKSPPAFRNHRPEAGLCKIIQLRPMIFSRGRPRSLLAPTLASR